MIILGHAALAVAVLAAWLATSVFVRMRSPLERLHSVTYVNIVTLAFITLAGVFSAGITSQTLKCMLLVLTNLSVGALGSHVVARAVYARSGEKR